MAEDGNRASGTTVSHPPIFQRRESSGLLTRQSASLQPHSAGLGFLVFLFLARHQLRNCLFSRRQTLHIINQKQAVYLHF